MRSTSFTVLLLLGACAVACGEPQPKAPHKSDEVPANSLSDAEFHGGDAGGTRATTDAPNDPTQPLITKVGETPIDPEALANGSGSSAEKGKPGAKPGPAGAKGALSRAECDKAMDRYLTLEIAANPQLKGVSPEVIAQAKASMREKHGESECANNTRAQYTCAMAAGSTAAWQKCMK